jgi:hypothetical protein
MTKLFLISILVLLFTLPLFAQSVDTAWVRKYNGPGNSYDQVNAIIVYDFHNIYMNGFSQSSKKLHKYTFDKSI